MSDDLRGSSRASRADDYAGAATAIQSHGVLLVVDPLDGRVVQASASAAGVFGVAMDRILGAPWNTLVQSSADPARESAGSSLPVHLRHLPVRFPQAKVVQTRYSACWHLYLDRWLLEIEAESGRSDQIDLRRAREIVRTIDDDRETRRAAQTAADGTRELLGFDRVVVQRFDPDWNAETVAESRRAGLEPWLGLHYHASAVPASARERYLRTRVRAIADVSRSGSPLLASASSAGVAIDMADVSVRGAAPQHLACLAAQGVAASLVVGVVIDDRLWGLLVCHHGSPRYADHEVRDVADMIARALASRIGTLEHVERGVIEARLIVVRENIVSHLAGASAITAALLRDFSPALLELANGDGVVLFDSRVSSRFGRLPDDATLLRLRERIIDTGGATMRNDVPGVLYTHSLDASFPELAAVATDAAGILYIPLDTQSRSAILWTRGEEIRSVRWAGNRAQPAFSGGHADEARERGTGPWQEMVVGRSRDWRKVHLESARALRVLVELMDRRHYQHGMSVLHAALAKLAQPLVVLSVDIDGGGGVEVTYASPGFIAATGIEDTAGVLRAWNFDAHATKTRFATLDPFRIASADSVRGSVRLPEMDLRPIGIENGRRCWVGVVPGPAPSG